MAPPCSYLSISSTMKSINTSLSCHPFLHFQYTWCYGVPRTISSSLCICVTITFQTSKIECLFRHKVPLDVPPCALLWHMNHLWRLETKYSHAILGWCSYVLSMTNTLVKFVSIFKRAFCSWQDTKLQALFISFGVLSTLYVHNISHRVIIAHGNIHMDMLCIGCKNGCISAPYLPLRSFLFFLVFTWSHLLHHDFDQEVI